MKRRSIGWPIFVLFGFLVSLSPMNLPGDIAFYDGPSNSYGSFYESEDSRYSPSEVDRQTAIRRDKRDAELREVKERRQSDRDERAVRRRAARKEYVPQPRQEEHLVISSPLNTMTMDQVVDSMLAAEGNQSTSTTQAPPTIKGMTTVLVGDEVYYYSEGQFYILMGDKPSAVPAPPGALVTKIPDGFQVQDIDGQRYYQFGTDYYERVMVFGKSAFKVVPPPGGSEIK
jgi:Family of unknown function (DUF6515)